jgi:hypothetical protein
VFLYGHMHAELRSGGRREMVAAAHGTVCVNTAEVPRWREVDGVRRHHFTVVDLSGAQKPALQEVRSVWVAASSSSRGTNGSARGDEYTIVDDEQLLRRDEDGTLHILDTSTLKWHSQATACP